MDIRNWCNAGRGRQRSIRLGRCYNKIGSVNSSSSSSSSSVGLNGLRWKVLWRKLKRENRKMFEYSSAPPYDEYTYSQNFDQGWGREEPENLSRSFSVRFADSSRVFQRKATVQC